MLIPPTPFIMRDLMILNGELFNLKNPFITRALMKELYTLGYTQMKIRRGKVVRKMYVKLQDSLQNKLLVERMVGTTH